MFNRHNLDKIYIEDDVLSMTECVVAFSAYRVIAENMKIYEETTIMSQQLDTSSNLSTRVGTTLQFFYRRAPVLIIIFGVIVRLPFVFIPQFSSGFQHTAWRQTDTASIAHNFWENGFRLLYPQINWGGNGPGYVETEFQLFPFLTAQLYRVFGEQIWLGLFVSLLFATATFVVFYALARKLVPYPAAVVALLFFVFTPLNLRYSVVFMPEPTAFFFYLAALYLFYRWINEERLGLLLLAAVSTALAILVKPTTIHIGFIFLLMLLQKYRLRALTQWQIWLFAVIALLPGLAWYLHARNLYLTYGNTFGIVSGGDSKFDNLTYWTSPSFYSSVAMIDIQWVFAFGGVVPFAIGIVWAWRKRQPMLLLYGSVAQIFYYLVIPRYTSFALYYHIFSIPFVALGVGLGLYWLYEKVGLDWLYEIKRPVAYLQTMKPSMRLLYLASIVALLLVFIQTLRVYRSNVRTYDQPLWSCSQHVAELVPEEALIVVSVNSPAIDDGVANNYQEPNIFYYSNRYGWALPADQHSPQQVADFHEQGADYFIVVDHSMLFDSADLQAYLDTNARQIGPGAAQDCSIYHFEHEHVHTENAGNS